MRTPAALLLAASPALAQAGSVWTVDDDGPADFAAIQDAIDAARPNDRVLVHAGVYAGFAIIDKAVAVHAAGAGRVEVRGEIVVDDLHGSQWAYLKGLHTSEELVPAGEVATLSVLSGVGQTWVEDCSFGAPSGALARQSEFHGHAATVAGANLILVRADLRGGAGAGGAPGGAGLSLATGNAWVHASRVRGGDGLALGGPPAGGGPGIAQSGGFVFVAGSSVRGGDGADALDPAACDDGGDGGHGLVLDGFFPGQQTLDSSVQGGQGGAALCGLAGADGVPRLELAPSKITDYPGATVGIEVLPRPAHDAPQTFTVAGAPGDLVFLICSFLHDTTDVPGGIGWLLLMEPAPLLGMALLPPSGTLAIQRPLPPGIFPAFASVTCYVQPLALRAGGELVYGAPASFAVLSPPR